MDLTLLRALTLGTNLLVLAAVGGVAVIAVVIAMRLTRLDRCREAAWVIALAWAGYLVLRMSTVLLRGFLPYIEHHLVLRWVDFGVELLCMGAMVVCGVGLFLLRRARGGAHG
jgi:hypothetical protein